jgi:HD-like signal output (HDOD) protein
MTRELDELNRLLEQVRNLQPLPNGVADLLALDASDPMFVEKTTRIVEADPALTVQILKVANSAAFSGQQIVDTVERAIMRVGVRMVVGTVAQTHLQGTFDVGEEPMASLWFGNVLAANLALRLAAAAPVGVTPETAYTYGLLHDVGRLVMVELLGQGLQELVDEAPPLRTELVRRERALFGFDHAVAGRLLGNRWRLPPDITLVIAAHHLPAGERAGYPAKTNRLIDLMALTDEISHVVQSRLASEKDVEHALTAHLAIPEVSALTEAVGVGTDAAVSAAVEAMAAVEKQRALVHSRRG